MDLFFRKKNEEIIVFLDLSQKKKIIATSSFYRIIFIY